MNVLLISDDGVGSVGTQILQETAAAVWPKAKVITMSPTKPMSNASFGVSPGMDGSGVPYVTSKEVSPGLHAVDGTPVDCLYLGVLYPTYFLGTDNFDVVVTGIRRGSSVGVDVFHSGVSAVAALAATLFGLASIAFSQEVDDVAEVDPGSRAPFAVAEVFARKVLLSHAFTPGSCLNVNFPKENPKGFKKSQPAPFSSKMEVRGGTTNPNYDVALLRQGFISVSDIELSVSPSMSY